MTRIIVVGAPSLTGGGVAHLLAEKLASLSFPAAVEVENRMPFQISLTEISAAFLQPAADLDNCKTEAEVRALPELIRLATNIEAIAEHHRFPEALILRFPGLEDDAAPVIPADVLDAQVPPSEPEAPTGEGDQAGAQDAPSEPEDLTGESAQKADATEQQADEGTAPKRGRPRSTK